MVTGITNYASKLYQGYRAVQDPNGAVKWVKEVKDGNKIIQRTITAAGNKVKRVLNGDELVSKSVVKSGTSMNEPGTKWTVGFINKTPDVAIMNNADRSMGYTFLRPDSGKGWEKIG